MYHSTLGLRVIKKKKKFESGTVSQAVEGDRFEEREGERVGCP